MRSAVLLANSPDLSVAVVTCRDDHTGWSAPEVRDRHGVVLVRRGRFRWRSRGVVAEIDPTLGLVSTPDEEERFAHPCGGDVCTWLATSPLLWHTLAGDAPVRRTFYVDARLEVAHRRLLAAGDDPGFALTEELLRLITIAMRQLASGTTPDGGRGQRVDRSLVDAARDAIAADHPAAAGLVPLARLLGASPYRLSRAFSRELGVSLTRYRNRVRVGLAIDRIEAGAIHLGQLAADLGFADQAHLSRTVRAHLGHTPRALQRALSPLST